jgi:hypothetical protein
MIETASCSVEFDGHGYTGRNPANQSKKKTEPKALPNSENYELLGDHGPLRVLTRHYAK